MSYLQASSNTYPGSKAHPLLGMQPRSPKALHITLTNFPRTDAKVPLLQCQVEIQPFQRFLEVYCQPGETVLSGGNWTPRMSGFKWQNPLPRNALINNVEGGTTDLGPPGLYHKP